MVASHGGMEAEYKEGREYLRSRTAEKYMNTDVIGREDRAAGTRTLYHWLCDCAGRELFCVWLGLCEKELLGFL